MANIHKVLQENLPNSGISGDMYITDRGKIYLVNNSGSLQLIIDRDTLDSLYLSKNGGTINGTITSKDIIPSKNNTSDLGSLTNRYRTIYSTNTVNVSDKSVKKDINYILDTQDYYKFLRNAKFATFNYDSGQDKRSDFTLGFIANDFAEHPIGRDIVFKENDLYNFSMYSYTTTIALALQESMKRIEKLTEELSEHRKIINDLEEKIENVHNVFR